MNESNEINLNDLDVEETQRKIKDLKQKEEQLKKWQLPATLLWAVPLIILNFPLIIVRGFLWVLMEGFKKGHRIGRSLYHKYVTVHDKVVTWVRDHVPGLRFLYDKGISVVEDYRQVCSERQMWEQAIEQKKKSEAFFNSFLKSKNA